MPTEFAGKLDVEFKSQGDSMPLKLNECQECLQRWLKEGSDLGWELRIQFWTYSVVDMQTEMPGKEGYI